MCIILDCKNISSSSKNVSRAAYVSVEYDGKYTYSCFSRVPDNSLSFNYTSLTNVSPLTTQRIYYIAEMPDNIATENSTSVIIKIEVDNKVYNCKLR